MTDIHLWPDWKIVRELGSGSFGHVYEIHRQNGPYLERSALKVIRVPENPAELEQLRMDGLGEEDTESYLQRYVEEIRTEIGLMQHFVGYSNIVSYEDYLVRKREEGIGWDILIRMELLTPLPEYMASHPMSEQEVIRLGLDISQALVICHGAGILHRDIKPQNIFVNRRGFFKLGDFGISRQMPGSGSVLSFKGSIPYMAPETFAMRNTDARSDVYSLALVLYRILNGGREPFLSSSGFSPAQREEAQRRRLSGEVLPWPANGSQALCEVLARALSPNPAARYPAASEFHKALERITAEGGASQQRNADTRGTDPLPHSFYNPNLPEWQKRMPAAHAREKNAGRATRGGASGRNAKGKMSEKTHLVMIAAGAALAILAFFLLLTGIALSRLPYLSERGEKSSPAQADAGQYGQEEGETQSSEKQESATEDGGSSNSQQDGEAVENKASESVPLADSLIEEEGTANSDDGTGSEAGQEDEYGEATFSSYANLQAEEDDEQDQDPFSTAVEVQQFDYPEGALSYGGHHYYLYNDVHTNWDDALDKCRERGGYLAVINDYGENEALYQYVVDHGHDQAFFGLIYQNDDWIYLAGDTSEFRDWGVNSKGESQPNNQDDSFFHTVLDTHMKGGHWSDTKFAEQTYTSDGHHYRDIYTYICEWDG